MKQIFDLVEKETGKSRQDLTGRSRIPDIVKARALFSILAFEHMRMSNNSIAQLLQRDHTTIVNLRQRYGNAPWIKEKIARLLLENPEFEKSFPPLIVRVEGKFSKVYERFKGKCFVCGFDEITEVHHIVPRRYGGTDEEGNLVLLCPNHHALADRGMLSIKDIHTKTDYPQS